MRDMDKSGHRKEDAQERGCTVATVSVSPTGRITIPAAFRRKLGWGKGTLVEVIEQDDGTWVLRKAVPPDKQRLEAAEAVAENGRTDQ
jgi:AbrB family looped-hinge helix DNA binding protein